MPTPSQDRVRSAIERLVQKGEPVTNRSILEELRRHGEGASFSTINPQLAAWRSAHPPDRSPTQTTKTKRHRGPERQSVDAAIEQRVDARVAEITAARNEHDPITTDALCRAVTDLNLLVQNLLNAMQRQEKIIAILHESAGKLLCDHQAYPQASHPRPLGGQNQKPSRTGVSSTCDQAETIRVTPATERETRSSLEIAEGRSFGRLVMEEIFDVLVTHRLQMPDSPAMTAEEIISSLPAPLRSQITARIGRSPDVRYLSKLLQPRIERNRYVRRNTDGRYMAVPDWRERKQQDKRHAPSATTHSQ